MRGTTSDHCPGSHLNGQGSLLHSFDVFGFRGREPFPLLFLLLLLLLLLLRWLFSLEERQKPSLTTMPPLLMSTHWTVLVETPLPQDLEHWRRNQSYEVMMGFEFIELIFRTYL